MQAHRDGVEVVVKQVGVGVRGDLRALMSEHALQRKRITPADTDNDARECRRSCAVIACTSAFVKPPEITAAAAGEEKVTRGLAGALNWQFIENELRHRH